MPRPLPGEVFHVLTTDDLRAQQRVVDALLMLSSDNAEYLHDIQRGRVIGFVIEFEQTLVHYSYLFLRNKNACILGLDVNTALIGNAFTVPIYRGKGAQARSVKARASLAHGAGYQSILAETSPDNVASQRGMLKGGMRLLGRMDLWVALTMFVFRRRKPAGFSPLGVCLSRG